MSLKVDVGKSERYRSDGNASFKKGKWVEAIGHYTNAVLYNPQDPTAYSNRAQAFLKLDKFNDAERDCSTVLSLEKGKNNVKALYRRSLARKGLNSIAGAIQDIEEVLRLEKTNQVARAEYEELKALRSTQEAKNKTHRRPLSPSTLPKRPDKTSSTESEDKLDQLNAKTDNLNLVEGDKPEFASAPAPAAKEEPLASAQAKTDDSPRPEPSVSEAPETGEGAGPRSSFAAMRQAREGKKKAFAGPATVSSASPTTITEKRSTSTTATGPIPSGKTMDFTTLPKPASPSQKPVPPTSSTSATAENTDTLPPTLPPHVDTKSTAPGAGLQLLRYLSPTASPASNYAILSFYPPGNIPKILGDLLEPDNLGLILLALDKGIQSHLASDDSKSSKSDPELTSGLTLSGVREIITGLKKTKRWGMNVAMLSRKEREAGERVWKACGANEEASFR
ncbi:hypothetical protein IAU59_001018 [Kwoniella sp. CBS 9459]